MGVCVKIPPSGNMVDSRHNKDPENLRSSLKKSGARSSGGRKGRVVFDEGANEFFEADYIIVVRDDCGEYGDVSDLSDTLVTSLDEDAGDCECSEHDTGALSPPEGYKDMGLFRRDGTLRDRAWWGGGAVLVGDRSGAVFAPQHLRQLQLLRRLRRERMLRAAHAACENCAAHAQELNQLDIEYPYPDDIDDDLSRETSELEDDDSLEARGARLASVLSKHIAAGEERPRVHTGQQTTPIEDCCSPFAAPDVGDGSTGDCSMSSVNNDDSDLTDAPDTDGPSTAEYSPMRASRGILKGGRFWRSSSLDTHGERPEYMEQYNETRSTNTTTTTNGCDEDGTSSPAAPRSVRFAEAAAAAANSGIMATQANTANSMPGVNSVAPFQEHRLQPAATSRMDTPLILMNTNSNRTNSAVKQLFSSARPPPPSGDHLVTSDSLRVWDGERTVPRTTLVERPTLRGSSLRDTRKKTPPKNDTSLADQIRMLTCDVDDEPPVQLNLRELSPVPPAGNAYYEKAQSISSNSSSFSVASQAGGMSKSERASHPPAIVQSRHQQPHLKGRRPFLSSLAPLTACVGSASASTQHESFYYLPPVDRPASINQDFTSKGASDHVIDSPAPDVLAGTPGSAEGDDGLAAFAKATAPRTDRLRNRYASQEIAPESGDDEHDDYGFQHRPTVCGIKSQLETPNDLLEKMQNQLQTPSQTYSQSNNTQSHHSQGQIPPAHQEPANHIVSCTRNNTYNWVPYYSEAEAQGYNNMYNNRNHTAQWGYSREGYGQHTHTTGQALSHHVLQQSDSGYQHSSSTSHYTPMYHAQPAHGEGLYQNCSQYVNIRQNETEAYSHSHEHTSPRHHEQHSRYRRAESPPPIRTQYDHMYIPYNSPQAAHHYYARNADAGNYFLWSANEYRPNSGQSTYHHSSPSSDASTPQSLIVSTKLENSSRISLTRPASNNNPPQVQVDRHPGGQQSAQQMCPVAATRYHTVPAQAQVGGQQMICYSEKVSAPICQPAPTSPSSGVPRGAPEGAPALGVATGVPTSTNNSVYYAMNV